MPQLNNKYCKYERKENVGAKVMKAFMEPTIEILKFKIRDIITLSEEDAGEEDEF